MRKSDISAAMRAYVHTHLSPTPEERKLVADIYASVQDLLGVSRCLQVGSYARFTAVRSSHDLDVLFILGTWDPSVVDPSAALSALHIQLNTQYVNPTPYRISIAQQTHSITICFLSANGDEVFSLDIVPACTLGRNEFGDDTYMVPEVIRKGHTARKQLYEQVRKGATTMKWLKSDPRGYISVAKATNDRNEDFRRAAKLVKGWRAACKARDDDFAFKSFHAEQIITGYFKSAPQIEIFDAVFTFFCELPTWLKQPQIPDRADASVLIDQYIANLTAGQVQAIVEARDRFLIKLEDLTDALDVSHLLNVGDGRKRFGKEEYLFDSQIPMLVQNPMRITGTALQRQGSFRERVLDALGVIDVDRKIQFRLAGNPPVADVFKWKVKNDDNSPEPRGEITDNQTRNDPEHTKYRGVHFVECYAIQDGNCIARAKQGVVLGAS